MTGRAEFREDESHLQGLGPKDGRQRGRNPGQTRVSGRWTGMQQQ